MANTIFKGSSSLKTEPSASTHLSLKYRVILNQQKISLEVLYVKSENSLAVSNWIMAVFR